MTLDEHLYVEGILSEANAYNLKQEVSKLATQLLGEGHNYYDAYEIAFNKWCK